MKVFLYTRVSTEEQITKNQSLELREYCKYRNHDILKEFTDTATGKNTERKGFIDMMDALRNNILGVEAVVIYKLDRIGRSLKDLITISEEFTKLKVHLISVTNNIDTALPEGRFFFYIMGALAEYERELIVERSRLGLKRAKAEGRIGGRPTVSVDINEINQLLQAGIPKKTIAKRLNISRGTLYTRLGRKHG